MELFYRSVGEGFPIVILHGLYGASENWLTIAKHLSENNRVIIPDIRNHGQSPHDDEMDFELMANDVLQLLDKLNISTCFLMGHSMGGKLAIKFAFDHIDRIEKLIIVDVAPKSYLSGYSKHFEFHKNVVSKMNSLDLKALKSRGEAEAKLIGVATSEKIVRFLLKNLKKTKDTGFEWKLNIKSIHRNLYKLIDGVDGNNHDIETFNIPTMFIKGDKSDYILNEDIDQIKRMFSILSFVIIKEAGHWVHAEKMEEFVENVLTFINQEK